MFILLVNCNSKDQVVLEGNSKKENLQLAFEYEFQEHPFLQFRRSYNYEDSTYENENLRNKLDARNPEYVSYGVKNDAYSKGFKALGLLDKENTFAYKKWENIAFNQKWNTNPINQSKIKVDSQIFQVSVSYDEQEGYNFILKNKENKVLAKNNFKFGFPPDVTFYIADIDKDNQEELIALFCWYIVNGHNYDFKIYEIVKNRK